MFHSLYKCRYLVKINWIDVIAKIEKYSRTGPSPVSQVKLLYLFGLEKMAGLFKQRHKHRGIRSLSPKVSVLTK